MPNNFAERCEVAREELVAKARTLLAVYELELGRPARWGAEYDLDCAAKTLAAALADAEREEQR